MYDEQAEAIVAAIRELTAEVRALREAWLASPTQEINEIMLRQIRAQQGGILAAGGILKPPNH